MVGDGINDAPVLGGAGVSIAMSRGSALTLASADLILVGDSLRALPDAFLLARRATRIIRQNLLWAAGYNLLAMPLAAIGWVPPWAAAIGMSSSSIVVVLNALRLMRADPSSGRERPGSPAVPLPLAPAIGCSAMSIVFILIPVSLVLVGLGLWAFFWAVRTGQFDELDAPRGRSSWRTGTILRPPNRSRRNGHDNDGTLRSGVALRRVRGGNGGQRALSCDVRRNIRCARNARRAARRRLGRHRCTPCAIR